MPLLREIRSAVSCHVAGLPVPYRTTPAEPTFQSLTDPNCAVIPDNRPFPAALDPFVCNRYEIAEFGKEAEALNARLSGWVYTLPGYKTEQFTRRLTDLLAPN